MGFICHHTSHSSEVSFSSINIQVRVVSAGLNAVRSDNGAGLTFRGIGIKVIKDIGFLLVIGETKELKSPVVVDLVVFDIMNIAKGSW